MRVAATLVALAALVAALPAPAAVTPVLADDASVRVRLAGAPGDWIPGRVKRSRPGCILVVFAHPQPGGYTSASLGGVTALDVMAGGEWRGVDVKALHAAEPRDCQGDND